MTTGVYLDPDQLAETELRSELRVYGLPSRPAKVIDCRTCTQAGWGTCMLKPGECASGSKYVAAPVLRFWRQS